MVVNNKKCQASRKNIVGTFTVFVVGPNPTQTMSRAKANEQTNIYVETNTASQGSALQNK